MMCYTFKVRHGRITVARKEKGSFLTPEDFSLDSEGAILINFQTFNRQHKVIKGEDIYLRDGILRARPGDPWWIQKAVQYNERLKKNHNGRFGRFIAV